MDVPLNKTIKSFIEFKNSCPVCVSQLKLRPTIFPFRSLDLQGDIAHIVIAETDGIAHSTSVDITNNIVVAKPTSNPYKYINGHIYYHCPICKSYQYRSNYLEYDFYSSLFPALEVEQEIYDSTNLTLVSFYKPKKKTLVYINNLSTGERESAEIPFINLTSLNLSNEKAVFNKIKNILILL